LQRRRQFESITAAFADGIGSAFQIPLVSFSRSTKQTGESQFYCHQLRTLENDGFVDCIRVRTAEVRGDGRSSVMAAFRSPAIERVLSITNKTPIRFVVEPEAQSQLQPQAADAGIADYRVRPE
jgi:hypothetical protein